MKSFTLKIFLLLLINIVSFNFINAQSNPPTMSLSNSDRAIQMTKGLSEKLKFDDKQITDINAVHLTFLNNMDLQRKDFDKKTAKSKLKVLDKIKELNLHKENSIKKLLNPIQLEDYNKWLEETKAVKKETLENRIPQGGAQPKQSDLEFK